MKAYLSDYDKLQFNTEIIALHEEGYVFSKTYFYPGGGYQINDFGYVEKSGLRYPVVDVYADGNKIIHSIQCDCELKIGDRISCTIEKERRNYLSALHSAQHILSRIIFNEFKMNTTAASLDLYGGYVVLSQELNDVRVEEIRNEFQKIVDNDYQIESTMENGIVTVSVGDFDVTKCGGTHVASTGKLKNILILGLGKKKNILLFDYMSNYGKTTKFVKEYFSLISFLNFPSTCVELVKETLVNYNTLLDELFDNLSLKLNQGIGNSDNLYKIEGLEVVICEIESNENTLDIYRKIIKREAYESKGDICILILDTSMTIINQFYKLSVESFLQKLKTFQVDIVSGGGSRKKINIKYHNRNQDIKKTLLNVIKEIVNE